MSSRSGHRNGFYIATRVGRDVCLLGVGAIGVVVSPPSIAHFADRTTAVAMVWAAMFVAGTAASLAGVIFERALTEIGGSLVVGAAFLVWAVAALTQPIVTASTVQIALVFLYGVFSQAYRVWMIANRRVQR